MNTQIVFLFLVAVTACILTNFVVYSFVGVVGTQNNKKQRHAGVMLNLESERGRNLLASIKSTKDPPLNSFTALHVNNMNGEEEEKDDNVIDATTTSTSTTTTTTTSTTRETELGRMTQGIARTGMKDIQNLEVGDIVVAKFEVSSLNIWIDSGYEIIEIYSQGVNTDTGMIEKVQLDNLSNDNNNVNNKVGYTTYLKLYSPKYHTESGPVIVTPDEVGLITIKDELIESLWLALPGLFWVVVASTFASNYNDKYGGSFFDALFRS